MIKYFGGILKIENEPIKSISDIDLDRVKIHKKFPSRIEHSSMQDTSEIFALELRNVPLISLEGISKFSHITHLDIQHSKLETVSHLESCPKLEVIFISSSRIDHVHGFENNPALINLGLWECNIKEISGIEKLGNLKELSLCKNKINDISGLKLLKSLREVSLTDNFIPKITGSLPNLRNLDMANNQLETLNGIEAFPLLEILNIKGNPLSDYSALYKESSIRIVTWDISSKHLEQYREVWNNIKKFNKKFFNLHKDNPYIQEYIFGIK